jgi:uncharacterized small protein (DUF1192 family)
MPRRPRLDHSILDICLELCDEKIATLQRQRAALVAERDAIDARRDAAGARPGPRKRVKPSAPPPPETAAAIS